MYQSKGKGRAEPESDKESVDSMMMDIDAGGTDFEEQASDPPPKKAAAKKAPAKKAPAAKAPAKAPARGRGKKAAVCHLWIEGLIDNNTKLCVASFR